MSDPRNVAHAKKVTQEKKHQGDAEQPEVTAAAQAGKKPGAKKARGKVATPALANDAVPAETAAVPAETPAPKPSATLEGSLVVLAKLKDMEFHSRANLERLAELTMTVEDELKQKALSAPLSDVYAAQNALQTKLTVLIEAYKAECDLMQG